AEYGFAGLALQTGIESAVASLWYANDAGTLALMSEFYHHLETAPTKAEALRQAQLSMLRRNARLETFSQETDATANYIKGELVGDFGKVTLPPEVAQLGDRTLSHPYYWSGFTLIGSPF
ncbi:MAG: CHAT domain-containing protein, partial [Kamptonema sp. SIO4C4]|nr:CHAT domain-containing protein [Kamptonema sp. SIO4C4]